MVLHLVIIIPQKKECFSLARKACRNYIQIIWIFILSIEKEQPSRKHAKQFDSVQVFAYP